MTDNTMRQAVAITVNKDRTTVFCYFSDIRLDKNWRKEVNETTITTPGIQPKTIAKQDSYLSKKVPHHITTLECSTYISGQLVIYETVPGERFWLKTGRQVEEINAATAKVIYTLEFDPEVVRYGLGFGLPRLMVQLYTRLTMNKYLKKLKRVLEKSDV